ncbi:Bax inhibitor-1-like protein [Galdieria sulphuraria]|uniref:Bax inhibitor-1-like protein n=1 Tax=Galdieria sulphuraria TaxID=130081 RepID=M2Y9B8_GALSU|nr:Bax inhibitor-1-like protein [Galdieria sulphuraria]EME32449.1 Bax inhibitor-1-like protein [Galdieria sulphuraria]|eukprot:XP_005708969.1 Bax inhibitor-1-like protein [Galdieria sulphuraria]
MVLTSQSFSSKFPPSVRSHLTQVYWTLLVSILFMSVGLSMHLYFSIGYSTVPQLLVPLLTLLNVFYPRNPQTEKTRKYLLYSLCTAIGCEMGPLIEVALETDPSIFLTAVSGTAVVFLCFSGAAIVAERKSYLFLGGFLSSSLSVLVWFSLLSFLVSLKVEQFVQLYVGLFVFTGYVLYDTQLIIEKAYHGSSDVVTDAVMLFFDVLAIFVRILIILMKNFQKNEEKERRKHE